MPLPLQAREKIQGHALLMLPWGVSSSSEKGIQVTAGKDVLAAACKDSEML